jgi:hypothetical protein
VNLGAISHYPAQLEAMRARRGIIRHGDFNEFSGSFIGSGRLE